MGNERPKIVIGQNKSGATTGVKLEKSRIIIKK
jgi:hypothetical protein